jgi:hypothetical protein
MPGNFDLTPFLANTPSAAPATSSNMPSAAPATSYGTPPPVQSQQATPAASTGGTFDLTPYLTQAQAAPQSSFLSDTGTNLAHFGEGVITGLANAPGLSQAGAAISAGYQRVAPTWAGGTPSGESFGQIYQQNRQGQQQAENQVEQNGGLSARLGVGTGKIAGTVAAATVGGEAAGLGGSALLPEQGEVTGGVLGNIGRGMISGAGAGIATNPTHLLEGASTGMATGGALSSLGGAASGVLRTITNASPDVAAETASTGDTIAKTMNELGETKYPRPNAATVFNQPNMDIPTAIQHLAGTKVGGFINTLLGNSATEKVGQWLLGSTALPILHNALDATGNPVDGELADTLTKVAQSHATQSELADAIDNHVAQYGNRSFDTPNGPITLNGISNLMRSTDDDNVTLKQVNNYLENYVGKPAAAAIKAVAMDMAGDAADNLLLNHVGLSSMAFKGQIASLVLRKALNNPAVRDVLIKAAQGGGRAIPEIAAGLSAANYSSQQPRTPQYSSQQPPTPQGFNLTPYLK